jgi:hypothetical protein
MLRSFYGADFGRFSIKIGVFKSNFLETVWAPIIISYLTLFVPFHISHHIVKMSLTYVSPIISSTTPDRNAFRSHVAGLPEGSEFLPSGQITCHRFALKLSIFA